MRNLLPTARNPPPDPSTCSSSRRLRFDVRLHMADLNNVPLVSGTSYVVWRFPSSAAHHHIHSSTGTTSTTSTTSGRTPSCPIRDHRVAYHHSATATVRLSIDRSGTLAPCVAHLEVWQEYHTSSDPSAGGSNGSTTGAGSAASSTRSHGERLRLSHGERIRLGHVRLNLAEYVRDDDDDEYVRDDDSGSGSGNGHGDDGLLVRRHLMQDSKINSTLRVGVRMRQVSGTRDFRTPPLRAAPVFGGIAGVLASPGGSTGASASATAGATPGSSSPGTPPSSASWTSRTEAEATERAEPAPRVSRPRREREQLADVYRRTLTASWHGRAGEARADECVEDLFAGGDGWGREGECAGGAERGGARRRGGGGGGGG